MSNQYVAMSPFSFLRSLWRILSSRPRIPPSLVENQLLKVILNRRSIRRFTDHPVPEDVFEAILEAGRLAPSTVNFQSWSFAIFTNAMWVSVFGRPIPFKAQKAVIVMGDAHRNRPIIGAFQHSPLVECTIAIMNASLAAMNMNIAAETLGVASVMLSETGRSGLLDACYLKEKLKLPGGVFPLMTIVFGYPKGAYPPMPPKLPLDQICFSENYQEVNRQILQDWITQMAAGYSASHPGSSIEAQLRVYESKIGEAEKDLHRMIFDKTISE